MGRPLNKKYFGNRNIGTSATTTDDNIGGEGVLSAAVSGPAGGYTTRPTITFTAPSIPNGITATATILSKAKSATIGGSQTRAYPAGTGSIIYASSTWTPTLRTGTLTTVVRASATTIGFDTTTTANISGTSVTISGASITGTLSIGGVAIAAGQTYYMGAPTATAATLYANYADSVNATNPLTIVAGTGVTGATFTYGTTYSTVNSVAVATVGSFTTLAAGAQSASTSDANVGSGLTLTITYEALGTTITNKGSGYTASPTQAGGTFNGTLGTVVLTTDSGAVGSVTNQENAIIAYAWVSGSRVFVDIVKQEASRRYAVRTATLVSGEPWSVRSAILVGKDSSADGEMDITVVDSAGNSYWVTKLTAHKALLTRKPGGSGYLYATGAAAPWKLDAASGIYVQIVTA